MTNSLSALEVKNLSVGYDRPLVKDLHLDLKMGQRLIIYGSNGTGKSTLLQSLVKTNTTSKVQWNIPLDQILFLQQQGTFHSQTPDDVQSYLVNILLFKKPFAKASSQDLKLVEDVRLKLHLPNIPLKNLSGGQRQKLKMARGLLLQTKALLLDEPFNAIDQKSTQEIIHWLNETQNEMVQILILHDFEQIEKLKSPILWIKPEAWEILDFENWFQKVDRQFHSWMHKAKNNETALPIQVGFDS